MSTSTCPSLSYKSDGNPSEASTSPARSEPTNEPTPSTATATESVTISKPLLRIENWKVHEPYSRSNSRIRDDDLDNLDFEKSRAELLQQSIDEAEINAAAMATEPATSMEISYRQREHRFLQAKQREAITGDTRKKSHSRGRKLSRKSHLKVTERGESTGADMESETVVKGKL